MARKRVRFVAVAPGVAGTGGRSILKGSRSQAIRRSPYIDYISDPVQDIADDMAYTYSRGEYYDEPDFSSVGRQASRYSGAAMDDSDLIAMRSRRNDQALVDSISKRLADSSSLSNIKPTVRAKLLATGGYRPKVGHTYVPYLPSTPRRRDHDSLIDVATFVDSYVPPRASNRYDFELPPAARGVSKRLEQAFAEIENDMDHSPRHASRTAVKKGPVRSSADVIYSSSAARTESAPTPRLSKATPTPRRPRVPTTRPGFLRGYQPLYTGTDAELYHVPDWESQSNACHSMKDRLRDVQLKNSLHRTLLDRYIPFDMKAPINEVDYEVEYRYNEVAERNRNRPHFAKSWGQVERSMV